MTDVRELHEGEYPPTRGSWLLIEEDGPVWVVNSAAYADDNLPSDPLGPFHVLGDAVKAASDLARIKGIDTVYVRGTA
ncbi:hypothetical protein ACMDCR_00415 [Labrys okinawensis]|uniref:hypothetical protein n=1 Tax=Labrys okinawensis TaxID=346911 RepID=UPI0039BC8C4D